jgi:hypothetical protein
MKSKLFFLILILAIASHQSFSQSVAINTTGNPPHASAILDVSSTTKGLLVPRMTTAQRNAIAAPMNGLIVFDNTADAFYVYGTQGWKELGYNVWEKWNNDAYYTAGNVGIKTGAPQASLHIFTGTPVSSTSHGFLLLGDPASTNISIDNNEVQARIAEFTSTLYLQRFGNMVQIGNSSQAPLTSLFIPQGYDAALDELGSGFLTLGSLTGGNLVIDNNEIIARNNGAISTLFLQNEGGNVHLGAATFSAGVELGVTGDAVMTGNVRIGNTALPAGFKLGVDGKIICEELQVKLATDWADYVFDEKYSLQPLVELEKYIAQHKHLPGIPAAVELQRNGLSVGEMQRLQMEKIEELTLYLIDMNKQIQQLKSENAAMKKVLSIDK